jgi:hypothetical protein
VVVKGKLSHVHAWVVRNGEIIDPTLPEMELTYFPAHEWPYADFLKVNFAGSLPVFRRAEFLTDGRQVVMDQVRDTAEEWITHQQSPRPRST